MVQCDLRTAIIRVQPTSNPNRAFPDPVQPTANPSATYCSSELSLPNATYTANPNRAFQVQSKSIMAG